jgi:hypothetical protein
VDFLAQLPVFLFELGIHEVASAFLGMLGDAKRAISAPIEIIAQA